MAINVKAVLVDDANAVSNITNLSISGLVVNGAKYKVATKTANYTAGATDDIILCNNSTGFTISLPAASGSGKVYNIKDINTAAITIDANVSGGTIDGELTQEISQWENITLVDYSAGKWGIL